MLMLVLLRSIVYLHFSSEENTAISTHPVVEERVILCLSVAFYRLNTFAQHDIFCLHPWREKKAFPPTPAGGVHSFIVRLLSRRPLLLFITPTLPVICFIFLLLGRPFRQRCSQMSPLLYSQSLSMIKTLLEIAISKKIKRLFTRFVEWFDDGGIKEVNGIVKRFIIHCLALMKFIHYFFSFVAKLCNSL